METQPLVKPSRLSLLLAGPAPAPNPGALRLLPPGSSQPFCLTEGPAICVIRLHHNEEPFRGEKAFSEEGRCWAGGFRRVKGSQPSPWAGRWTLACIISLTSASPCARIRTHHGPSAFPPIPRPTPNRSHLGRLLRFPGSFPRALSAPGAVFARAPRPHVPSPASPLPPPRGRVQVPPGLGRARGARGWGPQGRGLAAGRARQAAAEEAGGGL